ncbi:MAG: carboxypeptidase regulatory-like domain-containing protein [Vicinamibacterales bacterium]
MKAGLIGRGVTAAAAAVALAGAGPLAAAPRGAGTPAAESRGVAGTPAAASRGVARTPVASAWAAFQADAQGRGGGGQGRGGQAGGGRGGGRGQARDNLNQPVGTGSVSGTVVSDRGTPVRRARVTLTGAELRGGRSTVTSDSGAFEFLAIPAGRFTLTASKPGYVNNAYGAKQPGRPGTPIQLAEGQKLEGRSISLPSGSVVTGIVLDDVGEPSPGTQVRVMRFVMRSGERSLQQAGQDTTDDRGLYRVYGLMPGSYLVSAMPRNQSVGAIRETIAAELESLLQQAGAAGGDTGGRGGRGGLGAGGLGGAALGGGRGAQALIDRANQLQTQLQQADQEQSVAYAPVFYPGTASPSQAQSVTLGVGEERGGVDFHLQLVPTARVSGSVTSATGTLPPGTQVSLVPTDRGGLPNIPGLGNNNARVGADGQFTFQNVIPGQYSLQARATVREEDPNADPNQPQAGGRGGRGGRGGFGRGGAIAQVLWAATDVSVGGTDLANLSLNLQPGMTVAGRLEFEGAAGGSQDFSRVRVNLVPRGQQTIEIGFQPPAQVDDTGRFTITGVAPGRYSLQAAAGFGGGRGGQGGITGGAAGAGANAQWTVKSAVIGGVDVLDFPIEIQPNQNISDAVVTFSTRTQELSGTLQDPSGRPTADYTIVLFPADNRYWTPLSRRISASRPDTDGRFSMRNMPPGEYRLTAITDAEPGEWYDPAFLDQLAQASIPVSIREGETKVQDIRVAGGGQ